MRTYCFALLLHQRSKFSHNLVDVQYIAFYLSDSSFSIQHNFLFKSELSCYLGLLLLTCFLRWIFVFYLSYREQVCLHLFGHLLENKNNPFFKLWCNNFGTNKITNAFYFSNLLLYHQ